MEKLSLRRVRLNRDGYDSTGFYWGHGAPLYAAGDGWHVRAQNREHAKQVYRAQYNAPDARFYR